MIKCATYNVVGRSALDSAFRWCRGLPYHGTVFSDCPLRIFGDCFRVVHELSLSKVVVNDLDGVSASEGSSVVKAVLCLKQIQ
jgi:hypothetical protein